MTRGRFAFFALSTLVVLPILAGSLLGAAQNEAKPGEDSLYKYLSVFTEALSLVRQAYVEESDSNALFAGALDGVTDALDPFSVYVPAAAVAGYEEARRVGHSRSGLAVVRERGLDYVLRAEPGSPAEKAGIERGDLLSEIQGRSTRLMPLWELEQLLAGPVGYEVKLRLVRFAETIDATFTLGTFPRRPTEATVRDAATVLKVPNFDQDTLAEVSKALTAATERGSSHLLVDLRDTSGGDPAVAYAVAALFVDGEIGRLSGRTGPIETFRGAAPRWQGRIVVLADRASLGPAEILAAVLRQKAGAELVGDRTFGHAGRQKGVDLSTGARLYLTDAFYSGPDFVALSDPLKPDLVAEAGATDDKSEKDGKPADEVLEKGLERLLAPPAEAVAETAEKKAA